MRVRLKGQNAQRLVESGKERKEGRGAPLRAELTLSLPILRIWAMCNARMVLRKKTEYRGQSST